MTPEPESAYLTSLSPSAEEVGSNMEAMSKLSQAYDLFDQNAACAHGWCLNEYGDGMIGIVKDDESDVFPNSDEAHQHVAISAIAATDSVYRDLCARAVVIEFASMAIRDAMPADEE